MKTWKRFVTLSFWSIALILFSFGCNSGPSGGAPPPAIEITYPEYDYQTISDDSIRVTFVGQDDKFVYRYRLLFESENFAADDTSNVYFDWIDSLQQSFFTIYGLNDGTYTILIEGVSASQTYGASRVFVVESGNVPAIRFYRSFFHEDAGDQFGMSIRMEYVDDIFAGKFRVEFDETRLALRSVLPSSRLSENYESMTIMPNDYTAVNGSGELSVTFGLFPKDVSQGRTFSGTADLYELTFEVVGEKSDEPVRLFFVSNEFRQEVDTLGQRREQTVNLDQSKSAYVEIGG